MAEKTLAQHAEEWWAEQGETVPERDTDEWTDMYESWVLFAFSDMEKPT